MGNKEKKERGQRLKIGEVVFITDSGKKKQPETLVSGIVKECIYYTGTDEADLYFVDGDDGEEYTAYYPNPNNLECGLLTRDEYLKLLNKTDKDYNKEKGYFDRLIEKEKEECQKRINQIEEDEQKIVLKIENIQKRKEAICEKYGHIPSNKLEIDCYYTEEQHGYKGYWLDIPNYVRVRHEDEYYICPHCKQKVITRILYPKD